MDRIYLPLEDLERFGVNERDILESIPSPAMTHLLNHQAERADSWFAKAEMAWSEMSANQKRLMLPARLMSCIYRDILLQMHRDRYDVFSARYHVPVFRKFLILLRVMTARN
jgi:phytoene synthase